MKDKITRAISPVFVFAVFAVLAALLIVSSSKSDAGQVSFGAPFSIENPDKRVSPPAAVIDDAEHLGKGT